MAAVDEGVDTTTAAEVQQARLDQLVNDMEALKSFVLHVTIHLCQHCKAIKALKDTVRKRGKETDPSQSAQTQDQETQEAPSKRARTTKAVKGSK